MKLQNLIVIFIIIILPIILLETFYINNGLKTIKYQAIYDDGLITATHDAIYAFEQNTQNDDYSENPEIKREILKSSIKLFEKSLCNTCGISSYDTSEIEEYIPALVFGMYDGFYVYSSSKNADNKNEHSLKNYVYYSEQLSDGTVIRYSLDNYVTVSGPDLTELGDLSSTKKYRTYSGYLITNYNKTNKKYYDIVIDDTDEEAIKYYNEAYKFSNWFKYNVETKTNCPDALKISSTNDPEDENSKFVQHKRNIMKEKMEGVLNSTITAYSERTSDKVYKMPKLSEEDWEKIYTNISFISFFQGKGIGYTKYNGYCVLNSTNNTEYVNPNLMYFIDEDGKYYHNIKCTTLSSISTNIEGYKIGDYEKKKEEVPVYDSDGNYQGTQKEYIFNHDELACYDCINGNNLANTSIYDYIKPGGTANDTIKTSYWTSLARERYNKVHTTSSNDPFNLSLEYNIKKKDNSDNIIENSEWISEPNWSNYAITAKVRANEDIVSVTDELGTSIGNITGNIWSYLFTDNKTLNLTFKSDEGHTKKLTITIDKIDTNKPILKVNGSTNNIDDYEIGNNLTIEATDALINPASGIEKYVINGLKNDYINDNDLKDAILDKLNNKENVSIYVIDYAGNYSNTITINVKEEPIILPIPDISDLFIQYLVDGGDTWNDSLEWTNKNVLVRVILQSSTLGSIKVENWTKISDFEYRKEYSEYKENEEVKITVYNNGNTAQNDKTETIEIKIDKEKPKITEIKDYKGEDGYVKGIEIVVEDSGHSGINFDTLMDNGKEFSNTTRTTNSIKIKLEDLEEKTYKFTIKDNAGNTSDPYEYTFKKNSIDTSDTECTMDDYNINSATDVVKDKDSKSGKKYLKFNFNFDIPEVENATKYIFALGTEDLGKNDKTSGRIYDDCINKIEQYVKRQTLYVDDNSTDNHGNDFDNEKLTSETQTCYLILMAEDKYGEKVAMYRKVTLKLSFGLSNTVEETNKSHTNWTGVFKYETLSDIEWTIAEGNLKEKIINKLTQ